MAQAEQIQRVQTREISRTFAGVTFVVINGSIRTSFSQARKAPFGVPFLQFNLFRIGVDGLESPPYNCHLRR